MLLALAFAAPSLGGDPSPSPLGTSPPSSSPSAAATRRPLTCAERYPDPGPAGVDLRLGCIVSELVSHYGGTGPVDLTPRLTDLLKPVAVVLGAAFAAWLGWGWVSRRVARRLAGATPEAWWPCPACHSLNPAGTTACYRCGAGWTDEAASMPTAEHPEMPQRFGRDKWGRDKPD